MKKYCLYFALSALLVHALQAQDNQAILDSLAAIQSDQPDYVFATFKSTRLVASQSVETRKAGTLELTWANRFWNIPQPTQAFVADRMSSRIEINGALSDRFTIGVGVSSWDGIGNTFAKYRLSRQSNKGWPLSISILQNASISSKPNRTINGSSNFSDKLSFSSQLILSRKFTRNFSLQLSPTFIHRNSLANISDPRNHFVLGAGARYRLGGHVSLLGEYNYNANPLQSREGFNYFGLGVNWEVTDLILQFTLSNSPFMTEEAFMLQTARNFNFRDGNLYFGFNTVWVFHLKRNKKTQLE